MLQSLKNILLHPGVHWLAFWRWFKLAVYFRFSKKQLEVKWVGNLRLEINKNDYQLRWNYITGEGDHSSFGFLRKYLKKGDLFVDVGANKGLYTIFSSGICGAFCIAFEPIEVTFRKFENNIRLNKLSNQVSVYKLVVSDCSRTMVKMRADLDGSNHIISTEVNDLEVSQITKNFEVVPSINLDHFFSNSTYAIPKVIKIDVERHELNVLKGAHRLLKQAKDIGLIIEVFSQDNYDEIRNFLKELEFDSYYYDIKRGKLINCYSFPRPAVDPIFIKGAIF